MTYSLSYLGVLVISRPRKRNRNKVLFRNYLQLFPTPTTTWNLFFHSDKSQDKTKPLAEWFQNSKDKHEKFIKEKLNTWTKVELSKDGNRASQLLKNSKWKEKRIWQDNTKRRQKDYLNIHLLTLMLPASPAERERYGNIYLNKKISRETFPTSLSRRGPASKRKRKHVDRKPRFTSPGSRDYIHKFTKIKTITVRRPKLDAGLH